MLNCSILLNILEVLLCHDAANYVEKRNLDIKKKAVLLASEINTAENKDEDSEITILYCNVGNQNKRKLPVVKENIPVKEKNPRGSKSTINETRNTNTFNDFLIPAIPIQKAQTQKSNRSNTSSRTVFDSKRSSNLEITPRLSNKTSNEEELFLHESMLRKILIDIFEANESNAGKIHFKFDEILLYNSFISIKEPKDFFIQFEVTAYSPGYDKLNGLYNFLCAKFDFIFNKNNDLLKYAESIGCIKESKSYENFIISFVTEKIAFRKIFFDKRSTLLLSLVPQFKSFSRANLNFKSNYHAVVAYVILYTMYANVEKLPLVTLSGQDIFASEHFFQTTAKLDVLFSIFICCFEEEKIYLSNSLFLIYQSLILRNASKEGLTIQKFLYIPDFMTKNIFFYITEPFLVNQIVKEIENKQSCCLYDSLSIFDYSLKFTFNMQENLRSKLIEELKNEQKKILTIKGYGNKGFLEDIDELLTNKNLEFREFLIKSNHILHWIYTLNALKNNS